MRWCDSASASFSEASCARVLCRSPVSSQERLEWVQRFQGICLSSDAYIPFRDNIDRANRSNVQFVAHAGSSLLDEEVTVAAQQYGMTMYHTGLRLFLH